ncbi:type III secretion system chaperone [Marinibactrum halimedae]|uniref:Type III secretion system chaperone n=1 Tax=Marinibactrum halimedae TaxID=1444977 RepID=A0AA37T497_9GAMM|nr:type III secretion system chaperone [Marinibactrum halimedae]MCD9459028.1 type III secretion system chaperone [Marinibactrum halimedae]GLS26843.1 hypothetical protein GCM10007877_25620 [Marinibactrum halimedae]
MAKQFENLMEKLAKHLGVTTEVNLTSPVELNIEGIIFTIYYENGSGHDGIILSASLGSIEKHAELFIYRALLEGNLFWSATGDATLGVNSDTQEAFLAYKMPMDDFDGEELATISAHFLQIAENWKSFIAEANMQTEPTTTINTDNDFLRV